MQLRNRLKARIRTPVLSQLVRCRHLQELILR
jgi:hypothetical protein